MRIIAWTALFVFGSVACSHSVERAEFVPLVCNQPAPSASQEISFRADVITLKENSLHVDFDDFGTDFSSIEVRFSGPSQWNGVLADIYYQGEAVLNGTNLVSGMSFEFKAVPPPCLDQPWLFLSDIQGGETP